MPLPVAEPAASPVPPPPATNGELIRLFLRLGFTAFGGPAAHIAIMKEEIVARRRLLTEAEFLDLLGAANLIPGPSSTELAIHIGYKKGGWRGLLIAGICFILPAALIVCGFAWAYARYGRLPGAAGVLYGVKPVVVAVVVQAIWGLLRSAMKNRFLAGIGIVALVLALCGAAPLYLLFGAGAVAGAARWGASERASGPRPLLTLLGVTAAMVLLPSALTAFLPTPQGRIPFGIAPLFLFFLKIGSVLYGSGYVLLAFLRDGLVNRWHWLSGGQLLDAVAVGQVTPGPVFTTATFIGYILGGGAGAVAATLGIFLPSFVLVAVSGPLVPRLRHSALAGAFLDGVNVATIALMTAVTWELAHAALVDAVTVVLAAASAFLLLRYRVNSAWLIAGSALVGAVVSLVRGG